MMERLQVTVPVTATTVGSSDELQRGKRKRPSDDSAVVQAMEYYDNLKAQYQSLPHD